MICVTDSTACITRWSSESAKIYNGRMLRYIISHRMNERRFVEQMLELIQSYQLEKNICLEITEETNLESIVQLGGTLHFKVIAEYMDTVEKRDRLVALGCTYLQGYLYSPAVPVEAFPSD